MLQILCFFYPVKEDLVSPEYFCIIYQPPTYDLRLKDPPEIEAETLGIIIADVPRIMLGLIRNMKSRLIFLVAFVLFITT